MTWPKSGVQEFENISVHKKYQEQKDTFKIVLAPVGTKKLTTLAHLKLGKLELRKMNINILLVWKLLETQFFQTQKKVLKREIFFKKNLQIWLFKLKLNLNSKHLGKI